MLAEVTAIFRDAHTGAIHNAGDKIVVSKKRFEEVNKNLPGYLVEVKPEEDKPATKKRTKTARK